MSYSDDSTGAAVNKDRLTAHHLLWEKLLWDARPESRCLRRSSSLIVRLEQDSHNALHRAITTVPVPNVYMVRSIAHSFVPSPDIFQAMDNLCFSIDESVNHPRATMLDRRLGQLMIDSVVTQRPFIRAGMI